MTLSEFNALTERGLVLLDGATGSNMRLAGMPAGVCTEQWILEHPEAILALQRAYVDAGSDIIYAPTFSANRISLRAHKLEDQIETLNRGLVELSRTAADGRALVAGDITTTGQPLEPMGTLSYQTLYETYQEQIALLAEAGVDLLVAETMLSIDETACAVEAAAAVCELPIMCTLTIEADGHLLFGGDIVEAVETLQAVGAAAVGLNCSVGPDQLEAVVGAMAAVAETPLIVKPNAGVPAIDEKGVAHYSMDAAYYAQCMRRLTERGARVIGGCCGTTPEYIRLLAQMKNEMT